MTRGTYTAEEIADYLRVHPYTVKRLARAGKIPGFKVGGQWRFDRTEIREWRKNQGAQLSISSVKSGTNFYDQT